MLGYVTRGDGEDEVVRLLVELLGDLQILDFEEVAQIDALVNIEDNVPDEGKLEAVEGGDHLHVLVLLENHVEDETVEGAVVSHQELLQAAEQVFAVGQQVHALEGQVHLVAVLHIRVQVTDVGPQPYQHLQQGLVVVVVVFLRRQLVFVEVVDLEGSQHLHLLERVVLLRDELDAIEVVL